MPEQVVLEVMMADEERRGVERVVFQEHFPLLLIVVREELH